jgi:DNA-binding NarL/FixJ family response regulator
VIADDHTLFRQGVAKLLTTDSACAVVGEAATGDETMALVEQQRPDVLLLDVQMPGPGAAAVITRLRRTVPDTRIVVLSMYESPVIVHELLDLGASAYLLKSIAREELIAAVHSVARDRETVLLTVSRYTIEGLDRPWPGDSPLSARELEVLGLAAQALSNSQIASRLLIREATVKRHLTNVYAKLGAVSRVDAIRKAGAARVIAPFDNQQQVDHDQ